MALIEEPVGRQVAAALRRAVLDHVQSERRRCHPTRLHVGSPGGPAEVFTAGPDEPLDHAVRTDIVAALLRRVHRVGAVPMLWVTRPGPLELQDVDAGWVSAAGSACAEAGIGLTLVVVTRRGWLDPRSGVRREWKRLRQR